MKGDPKVIEYLNRGLRSELLRTLTAASGVEAAVLVVRGFQPKWRARNDSNVRPSDS